MEKTISDVIVSLIRNDCDVLEYVQHLAKEYPEGDIAACHMEGLMNAVDWKEVMRKFA